MLAQHAQNIEHRLGEPQEITFALSERKFYFLQSKPVEMLPQKPFLESDDKQKEMTNDASENIGYLYELAASAPKNNKEKKESADIEDIILKELGDSPKGP